MLNAFFSLSFLSFFQISASLNLVKEFKALRHLAESICM